MPPPQAILDKMRRLSAMLTTLRPQQWVKNLMLFLPLGLSHEADAAGPLLQVTIAFFVMSLCASAIYVVNDICDRSSDKSHPRKKYRPLAIGTLSVAHAWAMIPGLLVPAVLCAFILLPQSFVVLIAVYLSLSLLYTLWLKQRRILDVLALAVLYTLRVMAGGFAAGTLASGWLLTLSFFLFLSLATIKRYAELVRLDTEGSFQAAGRAYDVANLKAIRACGLASGYLAVVVFATYCYSQRAMELYPGIWALRAICPLALFWIQRMWSLAERNFALEDPVRFVVCDTISLVIAVIVIGLLVAAATPTGGL